MLTIIKLCDLNGELTATPLHMNTPQLPKDIFDWDEHISHVEALAEFTLVEKDETKRAFEYLKQILGQDFLRNINSRQVVKRESHPLMSYLINFAPWTRRYLTRMANAIRVLEGSTNLEDVLRQLEEGDRFSHNILLLEYAAKLVQEGLCATFEPTLPMANYQKQPDARFESPETKEVVFFEIAILRQSRDSNEASAAMNAVTSALIRMPIEVRWAGRLLKTPAPSHLTDIVTRIDKALQRAIQEKCFVPLFEEGTFEIAVCPVAQTELLEQWCSSRGLQPGGFQGPPFNRDTIARLRRKIETEQRQLPTTETNAILIDNTELFIEARDIRAVMNELEEEVYRYPHIFAVIISGSHISGSGTPMVIQKGEHRYTRKMLDTLYTEDNLLLFNRYSPAKLSASLLSKFLRAF